MSWTLVSLWPVSFLAVAVVDDLCFKKFHNSLFLLLTAAGTFYALFVSPLPLWDSFGGYFLGGLLMLPLVLFGAMGAGDMKFMMCLGLLMGIAMTFEVFIYALFWGALIGVLQTIFSGRLSKLLGQMKLFIYRLKPTETHKIPYTVAILFGWMTHQQFGGLL